MGTAASVTENSYWTAFRDTGEIDSCYGVRGVCVGCEGGVEEKDACQQFSALPS